MMQENEDGDVSAAAPSLATGAKAIMGQSTTSSIMSEATRLSDSQQESLAGGPRHMKAMSTGITTSLELGNSLPSSAPIKPSTTTLTGASQDVSIQELSGPSAFSSVPQTSMRQPVPLSNTAFSAYTHPNPASTAFLEQQREEAKAKAAIEAAQFEEKSRQEFQQKWSSQQQRQAMQGLLGQPAATQYPKVRKSHAC